MSATYGKHWSATFITDSRKKTTYFSFLCLFEISGKIFDSASAKSGRLAEPARFQLALWKITRENWRVEGLAERERKRTEGLYHLPPPPPPSPLKCIFIHLASGSRAGNCFHHICHRSSHQSREKENCVIKRAQTSFFFYLLYPPTRALKKFFFASQSVLLLFSWKLIKISELKC